MVAKIPQRLVHLERRPGKLADRLARLWDLTQAVAGRLEELIDGPGNIVRGPVISATIDLRQRSRASDIDISRYGDLVARVLVRWVGERHDFGRAPCGRIL